MFKPACGVRDTQVKEGNVKVLKEGAFEVAGDRQGDEDYEEDERQRLEEAKGASRNPVSTSV